MHELEHVNVPFGLSRYGELMLSLTDEQLDKVLDRCPILKFQTNSHGHKIYAILDREADLDILKTESRKTVNLTYKIIKRNRILITSAKTQ